MTIGVLGASGMVGATLVERLIVGGCHEVRPLIHSPGNALRLARRNLELHSVDLLDPQGIVKSIEGCTHVVNCSRGSDEVMIKGLKNLLDAARKVGVERVVHLSSVAVYGEPPAPECAREEAPAKPRPRSYGAIKLHQDRVVLSAVRHGLPCVILCPPNISGPYSGYLLEILGALRQGSFALVEEGISICNLVDVRNLAEAIVLALERGDADGTRIFVTDDEPTTWGQVAAELAPLAGQSLPLPSIDRQDATRLAIEAAEARFSLMQSLKHLFSADVRRALRADPLFSTAELLGARILGHLPEATVARVRRALRKPRAVAEEVGCRYDGRLLQHQLRGVRHHCTRARAELRYVPPVTFSQSMEAFRSWYESLYGWRSGSWKLLRHLYL